MKKKKWQINDDICLVDNGVKYYGKVSRVIGDKIFCTFGDDEEIEFTKKKLINLSN